MKIQDLRLQELDEEINTEGSWAISYGDMITLLLTFFILFFSVDQKEKETQKRVTLQSSLLQQFYPVQPTLTLGEKSNSPSVDEAIIKNLGARISKVGEKLVIEFPQTSFFDKGKTDVLPSAAKKLKAFAKLYLPYMGQNTLSIKAFTDSRAVKGVHRFRDNLELSALRSISTMRVLQSNGLPLRMMKISGNGESIAVFRGLANTKGSAEEYAFSRKVILVVEPNSEEL